MTHEQLQSSPMAVDECRCVSVGRLNDDFDVGSYERDESEQEEEERIGDEVSSHSEGSDHDEGARDVLVDPGNHYPGPVEERVVRDLPVRAEVEEAMPVCTHVEDATPYDSWVRLSEA